MSSPRDLAAALAAEIRAAVAETSRLPTDWRPDGGGEEDHARSALKRCEAYMTPQVPAAAPLAGAKRSVVRLLRFLWRDQSAYNALMLESANEIVGAVAAQRQRLEEIVGTLRTEVAASNENLGRWMEAVEKWREALERREAIRDGRLARLEEGAETLGALPAAGASAAAIPPGVYSLFEEKFRGSPPDVRRKQRRYLPDLRGLPGPVLDVGCGRGEFLSLLREEGIAAAGTDVNPISVETCRAEGLEVVLADAVADLSAREPGSLGGVTAFQVVEHWPPETIFRFLGTARRAIAPGGTLIAETINSNSLSALKAFFLDPTHVRPVPPEALEFLAGAAGFVDVRVEYSGEVSDGEKLAESSENDRRLNRLLFAPQDYAVIARVPADHPIDR